MSPVVPPTLVDGLNQGDVCRIRYKSQSGNGRWYEWSAVAVFLDRTIDQYGVDETAWSLRPLAGTMTVRTKSLTTVERLVPAAKRSGRGSHLAKRPIRLPGAVEAPVTT